MKNILCFGDSNTWGYVPGTGARYAPELRWTGVLQRALGEGVRILEDGMNARTSVYADPCSPWRRGSDALPAALIAQKPLDLLILALVTNDLKFTDAFGAARGAETLVNLAHMVQARRESSSVFPGGVRVLVIAPIRLHPGIDAQTGSSLKGRYRESCRCSEAFRRAAEASGAEYLDAAAVAEPSDVDFVHMSAESHRALGLAVAEKLRGLPGWN